MFQNDSFFKWKSWENLIAGKLRAFYIEKLNCFVFYINKKAKSLLKVSEEWLITEKTWNQNLQKALFVSRLLNFFDGEKKKVGTTGNPNVTNPF